MGGDKIGAHWPSCRARLEEVMKGDFKAAERLTGSSIQRTGAPSEDESASDNENGKDVANQKRDQKRVRPEPLTGPPFEWGLAMARRSGSFLLQRYASFFSSHRRTRTGYLVAWPRAMRKTVLHHQRVHRQAHHLDQVTSWMFQSPHQRQERREQHTQETRHSNRCSHHHGQRGYKQRDQ